MGEGDGHDCMACLKRAPTVAGQIDAVVGDRKPSMEDLKELRFTTRVINEAMRLYPQPPVLIRRTLGDDTLGGYEVSAGSDIFISVWNLHRWPLPTLSREQQVQPCVDLAEACAQLLMEDSFTRHSMSQVPMGR